MRRAIVDQSARTADESADQRTLPSARERADGCAAGGAAADNRGRMTKWTPPHNDASPHDTPPICDILDGGTRRRDRRNQWHQNGHERQQGNSFHDARTQHGYCQSVIQSSFMSFIHDDFLLTTKTARRLYHEYAEGQPILDYHCHLPPKDVADNRRFHNLFEIWLEGDHYKWRAMRANGVAEQYCTGAADPYDKFLAWARTVPHTLRNPLYHWTHLELKRYFGIDELLDEERDRKSTRLNSSH